VRRPGEGYQAKLERLLREVKPMVPAGTIGLVYIEHDEDCTFLQNPRAACRCDPNVTLAWVDRGTA
jgi:hypothetical protein